MCFRRREKINSKFVKGEMVSFHFRDDLVFGYVYCIKLNKDGSIIYDVQLGGQCPAIIYGLKEEDLKKYEMK